MSVAQHEILGSESFKIRRLAYARGSKNQVMLNYWLKMFNMKP